MQSCFINAPLCLSVCLSIAWCSLFGRAPLKTHIRHTVFCLFFFFYACMLPACFIHPKAYRNLLAKYDAIRCTKIGRCKVFFFFFFFMGFLLNPSQWEGELERVSEKKEALFYIMNDHFGKRERHNWLSAALIQFTDQGRALLLPALSHVEESSLRVLRALFRTTFFFFFLFFTPKDVFCSHHSW